MFANLFPNLFNFTSINLYDLIQIGVTIILAVAAIAVGVHASRLNDQSVESSEKITQLAQQAAAYVKQTRQAEMCVAHAKQIMEIYNFFLRDIFMNNFFNKENELLREKCTEILYQSAFLFNEEIRGIVEKSVSKILAAYTDGIPSYTEEELAQAKANREAGLEIKIYEAFIGREDTAEDTRKSYENRMKRTVFLCNIREDIDRAFACFKLNLGPETPAL